MNQLIFWIGLSLVLSLFLASRLRLLIAVSVGLYVLLPTIAASLVVGNPAGVPGIHPASWLALVGIAVQALLHLEETVRVALRYKLLIAAGSIMTVAAVLFTFNASGDGGLGLIVNQIVAPFALFILVRIELSRRVSSGLFLARTVVALGAIEAMTAIAVRLGLITQPFDMQLSGYSWYEVPFVRALGTLDHPLALSLLMTMCIALLPSVRSSIAQVSLGIAFLATIFLTESRTGLLLGAVGLLLVMVRRGASLGARLAALGAMAGALLVYLNSTFATGLAEKLVDDTGSANARTLAVQAILGDWAEYGVVGTGSGSSFDVARSLGLRTSFENPFLMYMVDFGLLSTFVYFGAMTLAVLWRGARVTPGGQVAGVLVLLAVQTYSSVASNTSAGALLWLAVAFAARDMITTRPTENIVDTPLSSRRLGPGRPAGRSGSAARVPPTPARGGAKSARAGWTR
ncbi:hypothetical protein [Rathayibacter]|uniref:O-antigen ligase domain-containing protein n=1 Tax=Rathayibacter festucae DSM 15932 TaxID=1328866 RepID=A0A3Q9UXQ0_9MICO|nr:hypothetical protein [Rathayibacter]AZZ51154.1 hypothetical protein C1I64_03250 [Rathayibacter festucae DSM 15932]TDX78337.1 hypothetical protein EDF35_1538 [Rathayibacter sp. PhB151]